MMTPLISIVIPVYNIEKYLDRCVNSVCSQTYSQLEILLVNDGSTDNSGKICEELATRDSRIRVFHKENGGSSSARNMGIANAQGEYIGFVDSDDYISKEMYQLLYEAAQAYNAEMVQVGRDEIDEQGNMLPNICEPPQEIQWIEAKDFLKEMLLHRGDCSFCTKLIKKQLLEEEGFPIGELNEDFKLMVTLLQKTKGVVSLPQQTYHVFYRIGSNTRKEDKEVFSRVYGDCVNNADLALELVEKKFPELKDIAFRFSMFQRLEYLLHIPTSQMRSDNKQYKEICKYVRRHCLKSWSNSYLSSKNKVYLTLFAIAPRTIRVVHKKIKGL